MLLKLTTVGLVALFSVSGPYPQADIASLKREVEALKAQQAAMQKDLDAIKAFLQQLVQRSEEEAITNASIALDAGRTRGAANAKITLVEISDYHCPFCRRHAQSTQAQIDAEYIGTGRIRYAFVDYPIEQLHPEAFKSHEAAACAGDQGKYWEMHTQLFTAPTKDVAQLVAQGSAVGLDAAAFKACLQGGKHKNTVVDSVSRMQALGIDSTPTFVIGLTPERGQPMKILKVVKGAVPFQQFKATLDPLLR